MATDERHGGAGLIEQIREAVDRLAEALNNVLRGPVPEPAVARVRQPTPEEVRRYIRRRRGC